MRLDKSHSPTRTGSNKVGIILITGAGGGIFLPVRLRGEGRPFPLSTSPLHNCRTHRGLEQWGYHPMALYVAGMQDHV